MDDKVMICPPLSVGKESLVKCLGNMCAWYVRHGNYKGEVIGGDCALTTIADSMDGGLLCIGDGC